MARSKRDWDITGNPECVNQRAGPSARNERTETGAGPSIVRPPRAMACGRNRISLSMANRQRRGHGELTEPATVRPPSTLEDVGPLPSAILAHLGRRLATKGVVTSAFIVLIAKCLMHATCMPYPNWLELECHYWPAAQGMLAALL